MSDSDNGLTIQLVLGKWGGIHAGLSDSSFHITVGWMSFQVWFFDFDKRIKHLLDIIENYQSQEVYTK